MRAIRVRPSPSGGPAYSPGNPAPLHNIELPNKPTVSKPGEIVVQIKATTVIRDNLTWPELYSDNPAHPGNDFSGIVVEVHQDETNFKIGNEVYGMTSAHRGGTWAEYVLLTAEEAFLKPKSLSFEEAAALPLSALTADQALFKHAGLQVDGKDKKRVLITGAGGAVGMYLVQFAVWAGHHVIAATSSNARNEQFLQSLGAHEIIEYTKMDSIRSVDVIIDTVGGDILRRCWKVIETDGDIISIDSASWNFVQDHKDSGHSKGNDSVKALFFIVEPSGESMARISNFVSTKGLKGLVAQVFTFEKAEEAYSLAHSRQMGRGKVVLLP